MKNKYNLSYWYKEIGSAKRRDEEWIKEGQDASRIYLGKKDCSGSGGNLKDGIRYNVLYSNTELLRSALLKNSNKPVVRRRASKKNDTNLSKRGLYSASSEVLQNSLEYISDINNFDDVYDKMVKDSLLTGRGIAWVVYEPVFTGKDGEEELISQNVKLDFVHWTDFRCSWARTWDEVYWIGRRFFLNKEDLVARFGEKGNKTKLTHTFDTNLKIKNTYDSNSDNECEFAEVWEVWDKINKKRYFLSEGYKDGFLREDDDPYELTRFFPTIRPLSHIQTNDDISATPEFRIYRKQAYELAGICERISGITESLKANGVFPAKFEKELSQLSELPDNQYVGIDMAADLVAAGGLKNVFQGLPLQDRVQTMVSLYDKKKQLLDEIYEVTGIADIMRSVSNPNESATAQKIKGQFGSLRLIDRQKRVQNYIKELMAIVAELLCEHFEPETLEEISGVDLPTKEEKDQLVILQQSGQQIPQEQVEKLIEPTWDDVMDILRSDKLRGYTLDIETQATDFDESQVEKQTKNDFIKGIMQMFNSAMPLAQQVPETIDVLKGLAMLGITSFKIPRSLEDNILKTFDAVKSKMQKLSQQQQPNSDVIKAQAVQQVAQIKAQSENTRSQVELQKVELEKQKAGVDMQLSQQDQARKIAYDKTFLGIKQQDVNIQQQEANRKDGEVLMQYQLKKEELERQGETNTNIAGDVKTFE